MKKTMTIIYKNKSWEKPYNFGDNVNWPNIENCLRIFIKVKH